MNNKITVGQMWHRLSGPPMYPVSIDDHYFGMLTSVQVIYMLAGVPIDRVRKPQMADPQP